MNPYTVLGVERGADAKAVKSAYRRLSAIHHPDKEGGDAAKFQEVKLAHDVLSDPERRERYDKLGRTDVSKVTPQRVKVFIQESMRHAIEAQRPDGTTDDPTRENIRDKVLLGLAGARVELKRRTQEAERKLKRAKTLQTNFTASTDFDPVGDALADEVKRLEEEVASQQDALELSEEVERVLKTYSYKVDPWGGGTVHPQGPTTRSTTGSVLLGFDRGRPSYGDMRSTDD